MRTTYIANTSGLFNTHRSGGGAERQNELRAFSNTIWLVK